MATIETKEFTIKSPKWANHVVFQNTVGALPLVSASFTTNGGRLLIFASGAGNHTGQNKMIGMSIKVDTTIVGNAEIYSSSTNTHRPFVGTAIEVTGVSAGNHTITLDPLTGTNTDFNDRFSVTILELPF